MLDESCTLWRIIWYYNSRRWFTTYKDGQTTRRQAFPIARDLAEIFGGTVSFAGKKVFECDIKRCL